MNSFQVMLITLGAASAVLFISILAIHLSHDPYGSEVEEYYVGDNVTLKIGMMGDSQLFTDGSETEKRNTEHLRKSFETMKNEKVQVIAFTGDVGQKGTSDAFNLFVKTFNEVYQSESEKPILSIIMGNHDYWANPRISTLLQKRFYNSINEKAFTHKVINGFHFINWGNADGTLVTCSANLLWARKQLKIARDDNIKKGREGYPIFVLTHMPPQDTVYGSDIWGNMFIRYVFNEYKEVVSVSGHSHYSLLDERSIWQGDFTAVQTQSTAYIELEYGKENGSIPKDDNGKSDYSLEHYIGIIVNLDGKKMNFKRISLKDGTYYDREWNIPYPIKNISSFNYTNDRESFSKPPYFNQSSEIEYIYENNFHKIYFDQAIAEEGNLVQSYEITLEEVKSKKKSGSFLYFSDFFKMPKERSKKLKLKLPSFVKKDKEYILSIRAIESFGTKSNWKEYTFTTVRDN